MQKPTLSTPMKKQTTLLPASQLSADQQAAITHLFEQDATLLIAKMGAGKTVVCLMAVMELLADWHLTRILVIAPKKVCDSVWKDEHLKWEGCEYLSVAVATGNEKQRCKAVEENSDVLVINYENLVWLLETYKDDHRCDGLIVDELSRFKSAGGKAFKKLRRRLGPFKWRVGMTGTPVSEDYQGLYSQAMVVDDGRALGTNSQRYLDTYFYSLDYQQRQWALRPGAAKAIAERIKPLVYTMPDYRDALPPITYHTHTVEMPAQARAVYDQMRNEMLVEIGDRDIAAVNMAVLSGKLQQIASGFLYDTETGESATLHTEKLDALDELVSAADGPVLIAYWFEHDYHAIKRRFGFPSLAAAKSPLKLERVVGDWNSGRLNGLLLHPRSGGHGLNLAQGGATIIWYGPQWSRDLWEQTNARLWRTGQTEPVAVHVIETGDSVDQIVSARVEGKADYDKMLIEHLTS